MEQVINAFNGKIIVATGASGFIGNRLIELLVTRSTCKVRAIVRNYGNAIRLARNPVEIIQGDVLDKESIRKAFEGADFVFHCAYGNKGSDEIRHKVNLTGTKNVLELCKENGVSAFLFLSTVAVYGNVLSTRLTESTPVATRGVDEYGKSKLATEKLVIDFGKQQNLPVVVLQPTGVYGPWAQSYGIKMIQTLTKYKFPLLANSNGQANLVYIDDLIQAMLKSIISQKAMGNRYLINGPSQQTWKQFFEYFEQMLGKDCFKELSRDEIHDVYNASLKKPPLFKTLSRIIKIDRSVAKELMVYPTMRMMAQMMRIIFPRQLSGLAKPKIDVNLVKERTVLPINEQSLEFYCNEAVVHSEKAKLDFGYTPEFTAEMGFSKMTEWYQWYSKGMML